MSSRPAPSWPAPSWPASSWPASSWPALFLAGALLGRRLLRPASSWPVRSWPWSAWRASSWPELSWPAPSWRESSWPWSASQPTSSVGLLRRLTSSPLTSSLRSSSRPSSSRPTSSAPLFLAVDFFFATATIRVPPGECERRTLPSAFPFVGVLLHECARISGDSAARSPGPAPPRPRPRRRIASFASRHRRPDGPSGAADPRHRTARASSASFAAPSIARARTANLGRSPNQPQNPVPSGTRLRTNDEASHHTTARSTTISVSASGAVASLRASTARVSLITSSRCASNACHDVLGAGDAPAGSGR